MIVVNIYYTGENGNARKFAEEMENSGIANKIREEVGNVSYEYFMPLEDPETVLLIDKWVDRSAIDRHHETPMMSEITLLREKYDLHMRVERYVESNDLGDGKFIRK